MKMRGEEMVEVSKEEALAMHACGAKVYWDCTSWEEEVDWDTLEGWWQDEIECTYSPDRLFYYLSKDGTDD